MIYLMVERMLRLPEINKVLLAERNKLLLVEKILLLLLVTRRDIGRELAKRRVLLAVKIEAGRKLARRKYPMKLLTFFFFYSFEPIKKV